MRPRAPPVSVAITGCAPREQVAHSGFVALADLEGGARDTANMLAPPTSTASSIGRRATGCDDAVDQLGHGLIGELARPGSCVAAAGGQHDVRQTGDAEPAIQQRQPDARAQAEGHEDIAGDGRGGELAHPDHRLRHRLEAQTLEQLVDAALVRAPAGTTPSSPRPRRRGRSPAAARRRRRPRARPARSRRSRRACPWRPRAGSARVDMPVIWRQRVDVGGADDVADLHQRGDADLGARPRRRAGRTSARRPWG